MTQEQMSTIPVSITFRDGSQVELEVIGWRIEDPFFMVDFDEPRQRQYFNWREILTVIMPTPPAPPVEEAQNEE